MTIMLRGKKDISHLPRVSESTNDDVVARAEESLEDRQDRNWSVRFVPLLSSTFPSSQVHSGTTRLERHATLPRLILKPLYPNPHHHIPASHPYHLFSALPLAPPHLLHRPSNTDTAIQRLRIHAPPCFAHTAQPPNRTLTSFRQRHFTSANGIPKCGNSREGHLDLVGLTNERSRF